MLNNIEVWTKVEDSDQNTSHKQIFTASAPRRVSALALALL